MSPRALSRVPCDMGGRFSQDPPSSPFALRAHRYTEVRAEDRGGARLFILGSSLRQVPFVFWSVMTEQSYLPEERYFNRELSWIDFNDRVLTLAESRELPLLERVKFLAILPAISTSSTWCASRD